MKCFIALFAVAALLPSALADRPKLNQYASMDDCTHDQNILFHAAPVSSKCYNLDDATVAFFWAPGTLWNPRVYTGKDCNGIEDPLSRNGRCIEKGIYNSYKIW
ncbi:hypothetical protein B0H66DRAFT_555831 [Apodospora peruviana]|uniref:Small secreted protein n=1 Tax=Apodospora peruviana TaxID=516989 RepID=A0AAE0I449_9PEZI|nr:hypothetical protein B0H66DRAFT_555831 [Apodospora peruviana]